MTVRRKMIRSLAKKVLMEHGVKDAPVPVERVAKAMGIVVERAEADDDISGFLYRGASAKPVIGVNGKHPFNRQTFTIAHELGHHLLHSTDDVHVDRKFRVILRNRESSEGTSVEEKEANLFAAEILMPAEFLEADLDAVDAVDLVEEGLITKLAQRYGVSAQAMTFRLAYLGYVQL